MNRHRIAEDVDSARVAYGSAGALFAAAFIVICAIFCHSRSGAMQSVDAMDVSTQSLVFETSGNSCLLYTSDAADE